MQKIVLSLLVLAVPFNGAFAQAVLKRSVPAAVKRSQAKILTLKDLQAARAKRAAQVNQVKQWQKLTGRALPVHAAAASATSVRPYEIDVDGLFSDADLNVVENNYYFDQLFVPLHARLSAQERYLIARNKYTNAMAKIIWHNKLKNFRKNAHKIGHDLKASISYGPINYLQYMPQELNVLYLGEMHYSAKIKKEVINVLEQVRAAHPKREIFLMTEFLPNTYGLEPAHRFPKWLGKSYASSVWKRAHELKMTLIGLEDPALQARLTQEDFTQNYDALMDGTTQRNSSWAQAIKFVQQHRPNALIIVYAGGAHLDASFYRSVPELLGEKKCFSIDFDLPYAKPGFKPLFNYILPPQKVHDVFLKNKNSKLILSAQTDKYVKMFGFNLSVTVHLVPGETPRGLTHE